MNQKELEIMLQELEKRTALKKYTLYAEKYIKIVDKQGQQVPLRLNKIQRRINDAIDELEAQGKPVRLIILKARQEGVSTYIQSKILFKAATKKNRNALIAAHRDDSTNAIFSKSKYMYGSLPEDVKPLQKASNARELIFDIPTYYKGSGEGLNSKIQVQTASSEGVGRSDTYFDVHLSEFAFFQGNAKSILTGILQAVPRTQDTMVVIESTANGYNDFKSLWDKACKGENEFTPLFFAWHDHEEYQMPVTEEERITIMSSLSDYESQLVELYGLSADQIKWYRWTLANDCQGDMDKMKQENPSFPDEAFLMTGRPVFNNERIMQRIEHLKKHQKENPPKRGYFYFEWNNPDLKDSIKDESIVWIDDKNGYVKIYEDRKPFHPYVLGGDTKGEGSDFFAATVKNNNTGVRCATLHANVGSDVYTHQVYCLGKYFNDALIGIEINFNTFPIEELDRLHYPKQYIRQQYDSYLKEYQKKYGWRTDGNTRPLIIDKEIVLIRDNIDLFFDIAFLEECLSFVYDEKGRPDAMSGKHDDILFSDMIANEISGQQSRDATDDFLLRVKLPKDLPTDVRADLEGDRKALEHWVREHGLMK